ncbi:MAG: DUF3078 domain-containing protein [Salinimicrobium sp.]
MPKYFSCLLFCLFTGLSFAAVSDTTYVHKTYTDTSLVDTTAVDTVAVDTTTVVNQKINYWKKMNKVGMNLNEVAFVNWNSGGNNSFSALFHGVFGRKYKKELLNWNSTLSVKYGLNAQEGRELRKTEDNIEINSNFGYRRDSISNFYYSAKFSFNTQLSYGYRYPNTENPISKFMAPGYAFLGVGSEYSSPTEDLTIYISPVTEKSTFVLDQQLANEGMFGVTPAVKDEEGNIIQEGERVRTEFGFLVSSGFTKEIFENIGLNNQLRLYSDYLNKFGNIDVDWELNLDLRVNEYVKANIGSHLKYDDDVKFKEDLNGDGKLEQTGARVQWKQLLGVGLVYEF